MNESSSQNDETGLSYVMVEECAKRYVVTEREDGGVLISIEVPPRFRSLWIAKLDELRTTDAEIQEYEKD